MHAITVQNTAPWPACTLRMITQIAYNHTAGSRIFLTGYQSA